MDRSRMTQLGQDGDPLPLVLHDYGPGAFGNRPPNGVWLTYALGSRPAPPEGGVGLAGFLFRLETEDGAPAVPPTLSSAVPNWGEGDTIHLGKRTLRVVGKRDDDADQAPVLIVEETGFGSVR